MSTRPGDLIQGTFLVENLAGEPTNADATPVITLNRNNVASAVVVTITNPSTGEYGYSFTIPAAWVAGDYLVAILDLEIDSVPVQAGIAEWTLESGVPQVDLPTTSGLDGTRDEWRFWPNLEAITLRVAATSGYTSHAVAYAKRRAVTSKEIMASGGVYTASDLVWLIPNELLPSGVEPKPADQIRPTEGTDWTVLEIAPRGKFGNTWRIVTRNLVLAADLRDTCDVLRPSFAQSAAGQRTPVFAVAYDEIPCRLQETNHDVLNDFQGGPTDRREYTLWVSQRLTLRAGDVAEVAGVRYDVAGSGSWDRIDRLGEVRLTKAGV